VLLFSHSRRTAKGNATQLESAAVAEGAARHAAEPFSAMLVALASEESSTNTARTSSQPT
jgi:hypothetical protein